MNASAMAIISDGTLTSVSWVGVAQEGETYDAKSVIAVTPASGECSSRQVAWAEKHTGVFEIGIQWPRPDMGADVVALGVEVKVIHVHVQRQAELLEVAFAFRGQSGGLGTRQRGKQQARQHGNYRDNNQQFDQRESACRPVAERPELKFDSLIHSKATPI